MTILLFTHILLAIMTLVIAALAAFNIKAKKPATGSMYGMWYSFAGIVLTGFGLFVANPNSLGHLCLLTAVYATLLSGIQLYSKKVVASTSDNSAL